MQPLLFLKPLKSYQKKIKFPDLLVLFITLFLFSVSVVWLLLILSARHHGDDKEPQQVVETGLLHHCAQQPVEGLQQS